MTNVIVVSGLPRSGTSMMMNMLGTGGVPLVTDGKREPDEHNRGGYFELDAIKSLSTDSDLSYMHDFKGKAIKVICPLLTLLPDDLSYKVIFMRRDIEDIMASQAKMAGSVSAETHERLITAYEFSLMVARNWCRTQANVECMEITYESVSRGDPLKVISRISGFLDEFGGLDLYAMRDVVHQRFDYDSYDRHEILCST